MIAAPPPMDFFAELFWIDGRPLVDVIEPYRARIFTEALFTFDVDGSRPRHNLVLCGRAKKNWKSADLLMAALYRFFCWPDPLGNDSFLVASDEGQAADDLKLLKRLIYANPELEARVKVQAKGLVREDGRGELMILPGQDTLGMHGKSYNFMAIDELHTQKSWDMLEALALDPHRPDSLQWITSYASHLNHKGVPLYDLVKIGKAGTDRRMFFSWYSSDYGTDEGFTELESPEDRANPSRTTFSVADYLTQQKTRLPKHKYDRLHLNKAARLEGGRFDRDKIEAAIVPGRKVLKPDRDIDYLGFVDMSGGSADDATLAVAHRDRYSEKIVLDHLTDQMQKPPFNPRNAVRMFAKILRGYGLSQVTGDRYAGMTFRLDFAAEGIGYTPCPVSKSGLYDALEPPLNAGEVELLDLPILQEQLNGLVWRGEKTDHLPNEHDDHANSAAGAAFLCIRPAFVRRPINVRFY